MENIRLACSEVYCLLEILGDSYKNKLPIKFIEFINQNRNTAFSLEITENNYENLKISKDGLVLISFLNLKYWVEDENEKRRLIEIYKRNDEKKQEKLNSYKQPDWLKQSNKKEDEMQVTSNTTITTIENEEQNEEGTKNENTALVEIKKVSFFDKVKAIIRKFFNKEKE